MILSVLETFAVPPLIIFEYRARMTTAAKMLIWDFGLTPVFNSESDNTLDSWQPAASGCI
jgi:hypothetical protein